MTGRSLHDVLVYEAIAIELTALRNFVRKVADADVRALYSSWRELEALVAEARALAP